MWNNKTEIPSKKTLNAIEIFFNTLKKQRTTEWETSSITTNNALYYLIRKDPALRDEENKIKWELIETLWKKTFPESIMLNEDHKTQKIFRDFLQQRINQGYKEYSPHDFETYKPSRYHKLINTPWYKDISSGQVLWNNIHSDFAGEYKDKISIKFTKKTKYSDQYIRKQFKMFFNHIKKKSKNKRHPLDLRGFNKDLYWYLIRTKQEWWDILREEINKIYGGLDESIEITYYNFEEELLSFFNQKKQEKAKYRTSSDIELSNQSLYQKLLRQKNLRNNENKVNRKLLDAYNDSNINYATQEEVMDIKLREAFIGVCEAIRKIKNKTISPIEIRRSFPYFYTRIQESGEYKEWYNNLNRNDIFQKLIKKYNLPKKYKQIVITKNRMRTENFIKKRLQDFFLSHKKYIRRPTDINRFDSILYLMLTRKYRRNNKPDRLYILVHIVNNPKYMKRFNNQMDDLVRIKLKYSSVNYNIDDKLYKLSQDELNPEETMILQEEISILHTQISMLDEEEKKVIEDFYSEIDVDIKLLEKIIEKIKKNLK